MALKSVIESILLVYGDPITIKKLAKFSRAKEEEVKKTLSTLTTEYQKRGFAILEKDGEYQLSSHPDNASYIEELIKDEFTEELSRSALETLTIIAYKGPITRVSVEHIRGVNCSFSIRNLLMRGLIERIDNPKDSRSYLYRVTFDFLKHFGFKRIEELPNYEEFTNEKLEIPEEKPPASE